MGCAVKKEESHAFDHLSPENYLPNQPEFDIWHSGRGLLVQIHTGDFRNSLLTFLRNNDRWRDVEDAVSNNDPFSLFRLIDLFGTYQTNPVQNNTPQRMFEYRVMLWNANAWLGMNTVATSKPELIQRICFTIMILKGEACNTRSTRGRLHPSGHEIKGILYDFEWDVAAKGGCVWVTEGSPEYRLHTIHVSAEDLLSRSTLSLLQIEDAFIKPTQISLAT